MEVRVLHDPGAFVQRAASLLVADPTGNTVVATVAEMHRTQPTDGTSWWFVVEATGSPVGVGMLTPPWPLYVGPMPAGAAGLVADAVDGLGASVPGFNGEQEAVREAARRWQQLRPWVRVTGSRRMRLFRLGRLVVPDVLGGARPATEADVDLLRTWYRGFADDAHMPAYDLEQSIRFGIDGPGGFLLWETAAHGPVSFAGYSPPVAGVARIGPVYTPAGHRRHGYGAAVTAAASAAAGKEPSCAVVLFTDLANPTSNKIYTEIGYQPVRDYLEVSVVR